MTSPSGSGPVPPAASSGCASARRSGSRSKYVHASTVAIAHVRPKYACPDCQAHVVIAERLPEPIEKGLPGPGLIAHVAVSKYADHLPLHRQEGIFKRFGVELSLSTMCGW